MEASVRICLQQIMCFVSKISTTPLTLAEVCQRTPSEYLAQPVNQIFETNMYILVQSLGIVMHFFPEMK